jgi:hypothetical protein
VFPLGSVSEKAQAADDLQSRDDIVGMTQGALDERLFGSLFATQSEGNDRSQPDIGKGVVQRQYQTLGIALGMPFLQIAAADRALGVTGGDQCVAVRTEGNRTFVSRVACCRPFFRRIASST